LHIEDISEGILKINNPYFLHFYKVDFVPMGGVVVADTPADCQILFFKVGAPKKD